MSNLILSKESSESQIKRYFNAVLIFLENKSAELSFYWADILKQKKHYIRNVTADSFYEYRAQQISGYILCKPPIKYPYKKESL